MTAAAFALVFSFGPLVYGLPDDPLPNEIFADGFDPPPVAAFDYAAIGPDVTFTDASTDDNATIGAWAWDFGDGSTSTSQNPTHTFSAPGTYTVTEKVVDALNGESGTASQMVTVVACGTLTSYLHDFKSAGEEGGHPDFETYFAGLATGLVYPTITPGGVPTLQSTTGSGFGQSVTSAASFAQWYTDDPINDPIQQTLVLADDSGDFSYSSNSYFPIDGQGFGNLPGYEHNYDFTTMLHTQFQYSGNETFSFTGDDDVWVYINGHLAIDLGGVHAAAIGSVTLDAPHAAQFGLTPGQIYKLDFFQAQRHVVASDFTIHATMCLGDAD